MLRPISDTIELIALLALAGYFARAMYTVTIGLYRRESFRVKLNHLGLHALLSAGWLSILILYFLPDQAYLRLVALFAGIISVSGFFAVVCMIPLIAIGKMTEVQFKDGKMKIYRAYYSSDEENYCFQNIRGGKETVKRDSIAQIRQVRNRDAMPGIIKIYRTCGKKEKLVLLDVLLLKYDVAILSVIFTFAVLPFLV